MDDCVLRLIQITFLLVRFSSSNAMVVAFKSPVEDDEKYVECLISFVTAINIR